MSKKTKITAKTHDVNKENAPSQIRKTRRSQSMNSPGKCILFLQRSVGNRAVQKMMKSGALQAKLKRSPSCLMFPRRYPFGGACYTCPIRFQAKLKIGKANDIYEQETDRAANQFIRMPEPQVRQQSLGSIIRRKKAKPFPKIKFKSGILRPDKHYYKIEELKDNVFYRNKKDPVILKRKGKEIYEGRSLKKH